MSTASKPVKLQVNTSGAWRDVIAFDAAKDLECEEVMDAAERLGRIAKATLRIVMNDAAQHPRAPEVLLRWSVADGWQKRWRC